MDNPYQPPSTTPPVPAPYFHWKRTIAWAFLIFALANLVAFVSGLTMMKWEMYGRTMDEAIVNARLVRRIAYGAVGAVLYWRFAAGMTSVRLLHVLGLFALVQVIDLSFSFFVFSVPLDGLFEPWAMARSLLAAAVGTAAAWLGSHRAYKLRAVRGAA